jgi:hypothetical protein
VDIARSDVEPRRGRYQDSDEELLIKVDAAWVSAGARAESRDNPQPSRGSADPVFTLSTQGERGASAARRSGSGTASRIGRNAPFRSD